jgi:hypothetical protein
MIKEIQQKIGFEEAQLKIGRLKELRAYPSLPIPFPIP